tara:strand:+ start:1556 stop:2599 length:1044 start_codon:yes stop_codon:yes gene_type:complete
MKIKDFNIEDNEETFIIAEVAQAHDGSLGLAHSFIDAVAKTGANAIKFQTHIANAESTLDEEFRISMSSQYKNRWEYWKRMEFTKSQWFELSKHANEKNLIFLSSAFSLEAVKLLAEIGMPAWKIGSGEVFNQPLIDLIIELGGPILLSSGMSNWNDIEKVINHTKKKGTEVALFQCTSNYPTSLEDVGLNILQEIKKRFNIPNGLSDHSGSLWPSVAAIANHADFLEVHVNFDRAMYGPDSSSSLNFSELSMICEANKAFKRMRSNPVNKDKLSKKLEKTKSLFTKSLSPINNLPAGTILTKDMLTQKKPGGGICSDDINKVLGKRLKVAVHSNRILRYEDLENNP